MAMACHICNHPKRLQIDRQLVEGKSFQMISNAYAVDWQAVRRHKENHLSRQLVQAFSRKELGESLDLMNRIDQMLCRAEKIFQRNYDQKRDGLALKALGEQRSTIELLAKIAAYLHESRAMELQTAKTDYETQREAEEKEFINLVLDALNPAEADMWEKLCLKIHGEFEGDVLEYTSEVWPEPSYYSSKALPETKPSEPVPEPAQKFTRTKKGKYKVQEVEPEKLQPYSEKPLKPNWV